MRIASTDGSAFFLLKRTEKDSSDNIGAEVRAEGLGFSGTNKSVWFEFQNMEQFARELADLDKHREGAAYLESMSPQECQLTIRNSDSWGHLCVEALISRYVSLNPGATDKIHCRIRFEIDPSSFSNAVREIRRELDVG